MIRILHRTNLYRRLIWSKMHHWKNTEILRMLHTTYKFCSKYTQVHIMIFIWDTGLQYTSIQTWWCQYIFYSYGPHLLPIGGDMSSVADRDITLNSWKVLVTDVKNESNQSLQVIVRLDNIFQSKRPNDFTACIVYFQNKHLRLDTFNVLVSLTYQLCNFS